MQTVGVPSPQFCSTPPFIKALKCEVMHAFSTAEWGPAAAWEGRDMRRPCKDNQSFPLPALERRRSAAIAGPSKDLPAESRAGWDFHSLWKVLTSH